MTDDEYSLTLFDRLNVIRDTITKQGEDKFYISFSGGKDSTVLHHLVDMALPNNKIPRVFINTGIEYMDIVKFVKEIADERFVLLQNRNNIRNTLNEYGYPFKSKEYANCLKVYQKHADRIDPYLKECTEHPELLEDWEYIHNLPVNVKYVVCQFFGVRERERVVSTFTKGVVPKTLRYQFRQDFKLKISDMCCVKMEEPLNRWQKENNKPIKMTGIMAEEGGRRRSAKCIVTKGNKVKAFQPLAVMSKEFESKFIEKENIKLCRLYGEPFNFERTGCKGCPFALHLQEQLELMEKYLPNERKQCEIIWKPVYEEYRRIGYRLDPVEQTKLF